MNYNKQISGTAHLENTIGNIRAEELNTHNQFDTFHQMSYDGTISGALSFIRALLQRDYYFEAPKGASSNEFKLVKAVNKSLDELDGYSKSRVLSNILSLIQYGSSLSEVTLKKQGPYQVFNSISPVRMQDVNKFVFEKGTLKKVELSPAPNDGLVQDVLSPKHIDGKKLLFVRFQADPDNPLGRSILNGAWQSWKEKRIYRELSLIGASKNLSGVLKLRLPGDYLNKWLSDPNSDEALVTQNFLDSAALMSAGKSSYVVMPSEYQDDGRNAPQWSADTFEGREDLAQIDVAIERTNREMLLALQSSVLALGQDGNSSGSFALSDSKTSLMTFFLLSVQQCIADEFQRMIKVIYDVNGISDYESLPKLKFDPIDNVDMADFADAVSKLANSGMINPSQDTEELIREKMNLPANDYTALKSFTDNAVSRARQSNGGVDNE